MFQLIMKDQYGNSQIVSSSEDLSELVELGKKTVTEENFENALNLSEQVASFRSYWVEFWNNGELVDNLYYAGCRGVSNWKVLADYDEGETDTFDLEDLNGENYEVRIFIGKVVYDKDNDIVNKYYAKTPRGNEINDLGHEMLKDKMVYYIVEVENSNYE